MFAISYPQMKMTASAIMHTASPEQVLTCLKAADVKCCVLYAPPSETNFGGALLTGSQSACKAACDAFAYAVEAVADRPIE